MSMLAWNHSDAEVAAIGQVLNTNIVVLQYDIQNRRGRSREERTEWHQFDLHPGFAVPQNIFSRRSSNTLRLLHEDDVHWSFLIWMPDSRNQGILSSSTNPRMMSTPPSQRSPPPPPPPQRNGSREAGRRILVASQ